MMGVVTDRNVKAKHDTRLSISGSLNEDVPNKLT